MRPYRRLIALIGIVVPRRLRADWRQEWEAELRHRETLLAEWDAVYLPARRAARVDPMVALRHE